MKLKGIKILSLLLAFAFVAQLPMTALAAVTKSKYTGYNYTHSTRFDGYNIINGVDVSEHNGTINFNKVKKDGIDFAIIRVGYTGYTKSKLSLNYDKTYKTNIENAKNAGLKIGVYWYSQALTPAEAVMEAGRLLSAIRDYDIDMQVVFDYEFAGVSSGRLDSARLSKAKKAENALAFLNAVSSAGYDACLYANPSFLTNELDTSKIDGIYKIWLANYTTKTSYKGDYFCWQYSSKGRVSGIGGNTDMNFLYQSENIIVLDDELYTGEEITPEPEIIAADGTVLTKDIDYTLSYKSNKEVGTATIAVKGLGDYKKMSKAYTFKIIPAQVNSLKCTDKEDTSLSFCWDKLEGATHYNLYLTNTSTGLTYLYCTTKNSIKIKNLTKATTYKVSVNAVRENNLSQEIQGMRSAELKVKTPVTIVSGLSADNQTTSTVTLKWNALDSAEGYNIYKYSSTKKTYKKIASVSDGKTSYKVTSLKPGKEYKFKISATIDGKEKSLSSAVSTVTLPDIVKIKSLTSKGKRKITTKWSYAAGTGYELQWSPNKSFSSNYKSVTVTKGKTKTVKTATSKKYYVRVRAYKTLDGKRYYGKWSAVKSVWSKK